MADHGPHSAYSSVTLDSEDEFGRRHHEAATDGRNGTSDSEETDALLNGTEAAGTVPSKAEWNYKHIIKFYIAFFFIDRHSHRLVFTLFITYFHQIPGW